MSIEHRLSPEPNKSVDNEPGSYVVDEALIPKADAAPIAINPSRNESIPVGKKSFTRKILISLDTLQMDDISEDFESELNRLKTSLIQLCQRKMSSTQHKIQSVSANMANSIKEILVITVLMKITDIIQGK